MNSRAHAPIGHDRASVAGKQPPIDESTDVLVIGAGPAGICAALTAAGGGVRVTMGPIIDRPRAVENLTIATLSSVGFGLSPAAGRAIRDLVLTGSCGFADLSTLTLSRFASLEPDWQTLQGWLPSAVCAGE